MNKERPHLWVRGCTIDSRANGEIARVANSALGKSQLRVMTKQLDRLMTKRRICHGSSAQLISEQNSHK